MSTARPTLALPSIWMLLDAAAARGVDTTAVCRDTEVPAAALERESPTPAVERRLPCEVSFALWRRIMRELRDPGFPLEVVGRLRLESYELFGFLLRTSETFGDAFRRSSRYLALWSECVRITPEVRGSQVVILCERILPDTGVGARCVMERVIGEVVSTMWRIGVSDIPGLEISFAHPAPPRVDAHEAFFRAPVRWAQPETGLRFPASWLEMPLPGRDRHMVQYFERQAEALLARLPSTKTTSHAAVEVILAALPGGDASVERVARRLSMSPRTLRRRLAEEGTTFERLLQETRAQLADRYLARMDLSLAEIAQLLGYSDQSAFQRAFARWKGETPGSFRVALKGALSAG